MINSDSSNLATPTTKTPVNTGVLNLSASKKIINAPSIYDLEFVVEGPKPKNIEMLHQINCINCNGDLSKRWYVEYYIFNPETKKRIRKREYGFINKQKDADTRQQFLNDLKIKIISNLEFEAGKKLDFICNDKDSITYHINQYLRDKRKVLERESIKLYTGSLKCFHAFLKVKNMTSTAPHQVRKQIILEFRNTLTGDISNRSVNNHIDFVKGFFEYLIKQYDDVLLKNPCANITKLPSKSETHVAYSKKQAEDICDYLKEHDMQMLHFCRFIGFGFLRCKETRNLRVGDIDFDKKTITLSAQNAKTNKRQVKPMLGVLFNYLVEMKIKDYPPNYYVFTTQGYPGLKKTYDNCFQKKYKKVKEKFGLSNKHTIYSFRHTFICELLDSGASWHEIMKYTGHTTMASFEKYARSILNKPAKDLSDNIKINF